MTAPDAAAMVHGSINFRKCALSMIINEELILRVTTLADNYTSSG